MRCKDLHKHLHKHVHAMQGNRRHNSVRRSMLCRPQDNAKESLPSRCLIHNKCTTHLFCCFQLCKCRHCATVWTSRQQAALRHDELIPSPYAQNKIRVHGWRISLICNAYLSCHDLRPALSLRRGRVPPLVFCEALARLHLWFPPPR